MDAPTLTTERLILRAHRVSDHADCAAMWGNEDVTRFIGGKPQSPQDAWFRLLRSAGHWALLDYGFWLVADRATGTFLGEAGIADFQRGIPELDGAPEMGWAFVPAAGGRGIASEAVAAVSDWADQHLDAPEMRCMISPENIASIRVAEKCGFVRYDEVGAADNRSVLLRRLSRGHRA
jgi:RimJ/RimL family protein N-acetyltransferase